ncbi:hypothetical protein ACFVAQ_44995 [Streptomyces sp. NPDC057651]|uniref:hypothetical protein n=1 Tax=Streptomyces sp. NPDC057651 TaxID=3346194 RepID=UPI00369F8CC9
MAEALRITGRNRRPVFGAAVLAGAVALLVGGGIVAGAFAASWGLFLEAGRAAELAIEDEDSYVAYADQWDSLVKVAFCVYPLLLLVAMVSIAWLLTAQAVTVAYARERAAAGTDAATAPPVLSPCVRCGAAPVRTSGSPSASSC